MKTIAEIAQKANIAHRPAQQQSVRNIDEFAMQNINEIFKELCAILPAWRNHLRTAEEFKATRASFAKGMMENGIVSMTQVQRGLVKARQQESDFFPSVGKFCGWCKDDSWQEAFKRMLDHEPVQNLAEKRARQATSWAIRNKLSASDAEKKFKLAFEKYQGLEEQGLLTELVQLPPSSLVTEFDKQRNSTTVRPEQFKANSVFARIARKGAAHE
ncbi:replication protein P [Photobacterium kishitanii]|uniref:replication protein P n=1 Tax=Photobacterium kishitanii TaxID=318456 RepID=UPI00071AF0A3|nr:replication protein P [Photobacterium kishitanii]